MNKTLKDAESIRRYADPMQGVFSFGDVCRLFDESSKVAIHRRIRALEEGNIISRFSRGMYITPGFNPATLSSRIIEGSYLSLGTVLAKELMIGATPAATMYAVRIGKSRRFEGPGLTVEYVGVTRELFFGWEFADGNRFATREKALLDTLYFYLRGRTFSFDIYQDIDITRTDPATIVNWLGEYRNPRFVSFVKGYLHDKQ